MPIKVQTARRAILAIDPGTEQSAVVRWGGTTIHDAQILDNDAMLQYLINADINDALVVEQIASYGMAVGKTTFDTVWWSGRFAQMWESRGGAFEMVPRMPVKMHLCHSARAKDSNVWQALVDRFGEPGKKANPGLLYPLKSHTRAAFALAVYYWDNRDDLKVLLGE